MAYLKLFLNMSFLGFLTEQQKHLYILSIHSTQPQKVKIIRLLFYFFCFLDSFFCTVILDGAFLNYVNPLCFPLFLWILSISFPLDSYFLFSFGFPWGPFLIVSYGKGLGIRSSVFRGNRSFFAQK